MEKLKQFRKEESELFNPETGEYYTGTRISKRQCELMRDSINELEIEFDNLQGIHDQTIVLRAKTSESNIELKEINKDLAEAIQSAMRIKSLWVPPKDYHGDEHNVEFVALSLMEEMFEKAINKYMQS